MLLVFVLLAAVAALSTPTETCDGFCPCGATPPTNSSWCPAGCAEPGQTVDLPRCQPFGLWQQGPFKKSCPLLKPGALNFFAACADQSTASAPCTLCALPSEPVEQTICLAVSAETLNSVGSGELSAILATLLSVSPTSVFTTAATPGCDNATSAGASEGGAASSLGVYIVVSNPSASEIKASLTSLGWSQLLNAGLRSRLPASPPPSPSTIKSSGALGDELLPLRLALAIVVGVPLCCCWPLICIVKSGRSAAVTVSTLVGITGSLPRAADARGSAAALKSTAHAFFNSLLPPTRARSVTLRTLNKAECGLHGDLLGASQQPPTTIAVDEEGGSDAVQAILEVVVTFRSIRWAFEWRREVEGPPLAAQLVSAIIADGVLHNPIATMRLSRRVSLETNPAAEAGAAGALYAEQRAGGDRLNRRITLHSHA